MRVLWKLVGCLLCLEVRSTVCSTSRGDCWNDLEKQQFTESTIQIRTKDDREGQLKIDAMNISLTLESSSIYTLNITCGDTKCAFILFKDGRIIRQENDKLVISSKLLVQGVNLEWSPGCSEVSVPPTADGDGDADQDADEPVIPEEWILVLIASGVAMAVVAVGILTWSICSLCKSKDARTMHE